jgi:hypothetical protein
MLMLSPIRYCAQKLNSLEFFSPSQIYVTYLNTLLLRLASIKPQTRLNMLCRCNTQTYFLIHCGWRKKTFLTKMFDRNLCAVSDFKFIWTSIWVQSDKGLMFVSKLCLDALVKTHTCQLLFDITYCCDLMPLIY